MSGRVDRELVHGENNVEGSDAGCVKLVCVQLVYVQPAASYSFYVNGCDDGHDTSNTTAVLRRQM